MSESKRQPQYSIREVADRTGVSTRTVRYYVQRGLIDPPQGRGRGNHYCRRHIDQILRVRRLQREGVPLHNMTQLGGEPTGPAEEPLPPRSPPDVVFRIPLLPGIRLEIDAERHLPDPPVVEALVRACRRIVTCRDNGPDAQPSSVEHRHQTDKGDEDEPD